jgi:hypothetical protein
MNGIEMFFLMFVSYILPIIFLAPYCKHKPINFIPIFNFVWMIVIFSIELYMWLSNQNNDNDNLSGNL